MFVVVSLTVDVPFAECVWEATFEESDSDLESVEDVVALTDCVALTVWLTSEEND